MEKSRILWLGIALMALAAIWHFGISPSWQQRIPEGWGQEFNFVGISTPPDPITNHFPPTDVTGIYQRVFEIVAYGENSVTMQDSYNIHDPLTGEVSYSYTSQATVDPKTGEHLDPRYRGEYYIFPREVDKITYRIRHSYLEGLPLSFQEEMEVEGVHTYLFSYRGEAEYTESYFGQQEQLALHIEEGQEIRCADDQMRVDMWVEPHTGEIVKIDESCYAGDYIFDIATGERLDPLLRWGAVTAGNDVQVRAADAIRQELTYYLWSTHYIPLLLLGSGLLLFLLYIVNRIAPNLLVQKVGYNA